MKYRELIGKMTLEEKASLCSGGDFWHTQAVERLGIPAIMVTDGPHGLRKQGGQGDHVGIGGSVPATCFPTACLTAASWDRELLRRLGGTIADEARKEKVSVVLGPGVNIKRSPLCGRNFEYFSEDPYLTGELAANFVGGVQEKGIGTSVKHYCVNNQESRRMTIDSVVDERTLREIYLPGFEAAVKQAQPWTIMNSYNKINGTFAAENHYLLTQILRDEWGFEGLVVTDWGAENVRVDGVRAGNDLEMPASGGVNDARIVEAVQKGELDEALLDKCVDHILHLVMRSQDVLKEQWNYDVEEHHKMAREMAGQCMVLLKNEGDILPVAKDKKVAVIGEMAENPRYQGAGSSLIKPTKLDNALDAMKQAGISFQYAKGYDSKTDELYKELIEEAVETAKKAELAILFVGLTDMYEAEGFDRENMKMPKSHLALIDAVCEANPNVVVMLSGGSPVEMPWIGRVKGLLNGYLAGQASGGACVDVLFGDTVPTGKLPETYPLRLEDTSCYKNFPGERLSVEYREGIYVGYRYYDKIDADILFPFGFGLSYTQFAYTACSLDKDAMADTDELTVRVTLKNTGERDAAEIVQVYVGNPETTLYKAKKELRGFEKVWLKAGEEKTVAIKLAGRAFSYWNVNLNDWHVESGTYEIMVGASSRDIKFIEQVKVTSSHAQAEVPDYKASAPDYYTGQVRDIDVIQFEAVLGRTVPPGQRAEDEPLDLNCTLEDLGEFRVGRGVLKILRWALGKATKGDEKQVQAMSAIALQTPLRALTLMSQGAFPEKMAWSLIKMCTGHFFRGFFALLGGAFKLLFGLKKIL